VQREKQKQDKKEERVAKKPQNQILILGYARVERHAMPGRLY